MKYLPAKENDLDTIYLMGFDTWSDGLSEEEYLKSCRNSKKYKSGRWFVLSDAGIIRASLLIHSFDPWGTRVVRGIGSVATLPAFRRKGYGHAIISSAIYDLTTKENASIIFLYSDIYTSFYEKDGFVTLPETYQKFTDSVAMVFMSPHYNEGIIEEYRNRIPKYF